MPFHTVLGTTFRAVRDIAHEGASARAVEGTRTYPTDIGDLWDALTNPERIPRWFLPIQGDLERGGRYQLEGNAGGTITRCDPPDALDVTWEFGEHVSWVSARLASEDGGTRLTLTHILPKDRASEAHWATYGPGATGVGWDLAFMGLALFIDGGGAAVDPEAVQTWLASDDGKAFIRTQAEAWEGAHIEAGEAASVAEAMATRTARFYTGD